MTVCVFLEKLSIKIWKIEIEKQRKNNIIHIGFCCENGQKLYKSDVRTLTFEVS